MTRFASAAVVGSGNVGPDASADSFPTGTSLTASVIFVASGAVAASRPPFTADKCFLTVLISSTLAPQVTSALCQCCTSSTVCFASSGSSISADPPPESRKITSVFASHFRSKARMASAAFQLCSFGVGCPAAKYFRPGTGFFGSEGAATAPASPQRGQAQTPALRPWRELPSLPPPLVFFRNPSGQVSSRRTRSACLAAAASSASLQGYRSRPGSREEFGGQFV